MDLVAALQIQGLLAVFKEDNEYLLRRIMRWYSTTFHTPLHEVEALPVEYVLQHYFESAFEQMSPAQRRKLATDLIGEPDEEKEQSVDDFMKQVVSDEKKRKTRRKKKIKKVKEEVEAQADKDFLADAAKAIESAAKKLKAQLEPTPPLEKLPEINMSFSSDNLDDSDEDSLSPRK